MLSLAVMRIECTRVLDVSEKRKMKKKKEEKRRKKKKKEEKTRKKPTHTKTPHARNKKGK